MNKGRAEVAGYVNASRGVTEGGRTVTHSMRVAARGIKRHKSTFIITRFFVLEDSVITAHISAEGNHSTSMLSVDSTQISFLPLVSNAP